VGYELARSKGASEWEIPEGISESGVNPPLPLPRLEALYGRTPNQPSFQNLIGTEVIVIHPRAPFVDELNRPTATKAKVGVFGYLRPSPDRLQLVSKLKEVFRGFGHNVLVPFSPEPLDCAVVAQIGKINK
jgi:hypothetical protein